MATNEISSDLVVSQFREVGDAEWLTVVCETSLNGELVRTANELVTKCGIIKTSNPIGATISGSGAANTAPATGQVSLKQMTDWIAADQALEGRMINLMDGSVGLGDAILIKGEGKLTRVAPNGNAGESLTFDWEFSISGTVDTDESDES